MATPLDKPDRIAAGLGYKKPTKKPNAAATKKRAAALKKKALAAKKRTPATRKRARIQEGTWSLMGRGVRSYEDAKSMSEYGEAVRSGSLRGPAPPEIDKALGQIARKATKKRRK
jgi:hypothetical protein